MIFWDSSAVIPLLVSESDTQLRLRQLEKDPIIVVWWGTRVECMSALCRLRRESFLEESNMRDAVVRLHRLEQGWVEVQPAREVKSETDRLLEDYQLRVADSLQLASAIIVRGSCPTRMTFLTGDRRLAQAAKSEGFDLDLTGLAS